MHLSAGESEAKLRQLFQEASSMAPCIVFIGQLLLLCLCLLLPPDIGLVSLLAHHDLCAAKLHRMPLMLHGHAICVIELHL